MLTSRLDFFCNHDSQSEVLAELSDKITIGDLALTCNELCCVVRLWNSLALAAVWLVPEKWESWLIR
jgi:hypothetical protein